MFPEYRELIKKLKESDAHFSRLFDKHNELDQKIKNIENQVEIASQDEVDEMKKEKLQVKDELFAILLKASQ